MDTLLASGGPLQVGDTTILHYEITIPFPNFVHLKYCTTESPHYIQQVINAPCLLNPQPIRDAILENHKPVIQAHFDAESD